MPSTFALRPSTPLRRDGPGAGAAAARGHPPAFAFPLPGGPKKAASESLAAFPGEKWQRGMPGLGEVSDSREVLQKAWVN